VAGPPARPGPPGGLDHEAQTKDPMALTRRSARICRAPADARTEQKLGVKFAWDVRTRLAVQVIAVGRVERPISVGEAPCGDAANTYTLSPKLKAPVGVSSRPVTPNGSGALKGSRFPSAPSTARRRIPPPRAPGQASLLG
jgi:hypothetical protein